MDKKNNNNTKLAGNIKEKKERFKLFKSIINHPKTSLRWPIKIFFITLVLSLLFSISSELILTNAGIVVSVMVVLVLWIVSVVFDMVGVAVAAADLETFVAMSSKKIKGAKEAMSLVKNAEKVSSFASDVVGDICGILSGAVGAAIVIKIYVTSGDFTSVLIAAIVSSIIAALTVFGKAVGKNFAINFPNKIVFQASLVLRFFRIVKKSK